MEETQDWDVNNIVSDILRGNITLNQTSFKVSEKYKQCCISL